MQHVQKILLSQTSAEVKCLYPISSRRKMCTSSIRWFITNFHMAPLLIHSMGKALTSCQNNWLVTVNSWYLKVEIQLKFLLIFPSKFWSQKIYFEILVVCYNRIWNETKNRMGPNYILCYQGVLWDISDWDIDNWLYFPWIMRCRMKVYCDDLASHFIFARGGALFLQVRPPTDPIWWLEHFQNPFKWH